MILQAIGEQLPLCDSLLPPQSVQVCSIIEPACKSHPHVVLATALLCN